MRSFSRCRIRIGDPPGGRGQVRGSRGHRAQRFPEPDQQRPRVPGCLRRCTRRRRSPDHREHEDRCRRAILSVAADKLSRDYIVPSPSTTVWRPLSPPPWPRPPAPTASRSRTFDGSPRRATRRRGVFLIVWRRCAGDGCHASPNRRRSRLGAPDPAGPHAAASHCPSSAIRPRPSPTASASRPRCHPPGPTGGVP